MNGSNAVSCHHNCDLPSSSLWVIETSDDHIINIIHISFMAVGNFKPLSGGLSVPIWPYLFVVEPIIVRMTN